MIKVHMSDSEITTCKILGNLRTMTSRAPNTTYTEVEYNLRADEGGVVGEVAFCKHFNVFFNPQALYRENSYDAFYKNKRIDVKTTLMRNPKLCASKKINPDVDIFVLASWSGNEVTFIGFALASELYQEANLTTTAFSEVYALEIPQLRKFREDGEWR